MLESTKAYWKEIPAQVFFCEFRKSFKNSYFIEYLRTTVSGVFFMLYAIALPDIVSTSVQPR